MKPKRKIISLLLCAAMLLSFCPTSVFAEAAAQDGGISIGASGFCEHHPAHTEDCGYTEGIPGTPCNHEHTDECYTEVTSCVHEHRSDCYPAEDVSGNTATPSDADGAEPVCGHECSEESGCITKELDCKHEHNEDCGYAPATDGTPCGYVCKICKPQDSGPTSGQSVQKSEGDLATPSNAAALSVEDVQKLIDELPTADELAAMSLEEQQAVYTKLQAAYEAYNALTDEQKAEVTGAEIFESLFDVFNGMVNTLAGEITYISYTWEDGQGRVDHSNTLNETYNEINADSSDPVTWDGNTNGGYYVVTGGTAETPITFSERVTVSGNIHLILTDGCHLKAAKGITVSEGNSLTIYATSEGDSMGKLIATGADRAAGIGGLTTYGDSGADTTFASSGTITIHGGKINATGKMGGAGIGGSRGATSSGGAGGNIFIYGGTVTTEGGGGDCGGAGIGGGSGTSYASASGGDGGIISIYGGTVSATGGVGSSSGCSDGAGIGGGYKGDGGTINIYGGDIKAESRYGAGIGGGGPRTPDDTMIGGSGGKITITGGTVTAKSTNGAGIGGGMEIDYRNDTYGASGGTIRITGGTVKATGGSDACDIGGGKIGVPSEKIEILDGADVKTEGTNGIGKSHVADTEKWETTNDQHWRPCQVDGCSVEHDFITSGKENHSYPTTGEVNGSGNLVCTCACQQEKTYNLQGISVTGPTRLTYNEGEALDLSGLKITATFTGTTETKEIAYPNTDMSFSITDGDPISNDDTLTMAHHGKTITVTWNNQTAVTAALTVNATPVTPTTYTVTVENDGNGTASASPNPAAANTEITLTATPKANYRFKEWQVVSGGVTISGNKFTMPANNVTVKAIFEEKDSPTPPTEYTVTVNGSYAANSGVGSYEANKTVSIDAGSRSNYRFSGWTSSDGISFANAGSPSTTFVMPGKNVTVTANWTYNGGGGGGGTSYDYFTITASAGAGGSISPSGSFSVREGRDKTFTITPDSGYRISDVLVDGRSVGAVSSYTFDNVQKRHTIEAVFAKENPSTGGNPFTDVRESDWFYDDVMFVYGNGLMSGTSATTFEPNANTTRAQIAAIFYRLDGSPAVEGRNNYTDVGYGPGTAWYYDAVTWAQQSGVMSGYGNNLFGPNDTVTRQQLAVTFYNYAKYKGYDVTAAGDLSGFADAGEISPWAQDAMKWAVGIGLMNGKGGGILDPQGTATRAEVAAMLHNFIERNHLVPPAVAPGGDGGAGGTGNGGGGWTQRTSSPQTGDNTPIWPFATLPVSAAGLVTGTILYCKRRKEEDEEPACYPA